MKSVNIVLWICFLGMFSVDIFCYLIKTNKLIHFDYSVVQRMKNALHALIAFPQNNLRLFINGKLVYGDGNRIEDLRAILNGHFGNDLR